tara:strand:- start:197 stop:463 length:267 start_codon:yes stop_codon:yes gene_type:complete
MRFELKTDQNRFSDKISLSFAILVLAFCAILVTNVSLNINKLATYQEINYLCRLIIVDKSQTNFKKLSKLTKQLKKQKIWDFCKEFSY